MEKSIVCNQCGQKLEIKCVKEAQGIIEVEPCGTCIWNERQEAYSDGRDVGWDEASELRDRN